jgi:EAL domain-containing protein (putative c-di-GMP-specific phosphodiesterase class I)
VPVRASISQISWLAGAWASGSGPVSFEERWTAAAGGAMLAVSRTIKGDRMVAFEFLRIVERAVEKSGLLPRDLRLEITETALMDSPAIAAQVLSQLREFGAKIYLDDFGTGYSSLSHLHKLPVDALKIDRSFVTTIGVSERPAIVESILALARTMNTSVVAEGIETDVQARVLERLGCTHAQGYLFSPPLAVAALDDRGGRAEIPTAKLRLAVKEPFRAGGFARFETMLRLNRASQRLVFTVRDEVNGNTIWQQVDLLPDEKVSAKKGGS